MSTFKDSLPPDLFDTTTLVSLASTVVILGVAYALSLQFLDTKTTTGAHRFLFIWHAFDAGIHFFLEGSFLYHCLFSWVPLSSVSNPAALAPTAPNYLGHNDRAYGPQAGGDDPFAQLWMVYGKADKRWAGADLSVVSLEALTVFIAGPLACLACYYLARKDPKANVIMVVVATMELYGGWMTFCPEWLTMSTYLDTSNFMYLWLYLVFFNTLWVFIPGYAVWYAVTDMNDAYAVRSKGFVTKKTK